MILSVKVRQSFTEIYGFFNRFLLALFFRDNFLMLFEIFRTSPSSGRMRKWDRIII